MKTKNLFPRLILVALFSLASISLAAQRMGIPKGSYKLGPNSAKSINNYRFSLDPNISHAVEFGKLPGPKLLNSIELYGLALDAKLVNPIDFYGLALEANLAKPMEIYRPPFEPNVVNPLNIYRPSLDLQVPSLNPSIVRPVDPPKLNYSADIPRWQATNSRYQDLLDAGAGEPRAGEDPYKERIGAFQTALDLPMTKEMDPATEKELLRVLAEQSRVSDFNQGTEYYVYLTFEPAPNGPDEFRAFFGKGREIYRGASLKDAFAKTIEQAGPQTQSLYVDLKDFGEKRAQAIQTNLARDIDPKTSPQKIIFLPRDQVSAELQNLAFKPGVQKINPEPIKKVTAGPRKGWFLLAFECVKQTGEKFSLMIYGASRATVELFQQRLLERFASPSAKSPLDEIIFIKKNLGIKPQEIKIELNGFEIAATTTRRIDEPSAA